MNKSTQIRVAIITIILLLVGVGVWGYTTFTKYSPKEFVVETPAGSTTKNIITGESVNNVKRFTVAEIVTHRDQTSCYTTINGSVYDLTAWVMLHPGGKDKILSLCGTDGTERFTKKHKGGQKFMDILARFKIGTL